MLDLVFYACYKKFEKSGEKSLLVLNACVFLAFILFMNVAALFLILDNLRYITLENVPNVSGPICYGIILGLLYFFFKYKKRYEGVLIFYSKKNINIELYSTGYFFFSILFFLLIGLL